MLSLKAKSNCNLNFARLILSLTKVHHTNLYSTNTEVVTIQLRKKEAESSTFIKREQAIAWPHKLTFLNFFVSIIFFPEKLGCFLVLLVGGALFLKKASPFFPLVLNFGLDGIFLCKRNLVQIKLTNNAHYGVIIFLIPIKDKKIFDLTILSVFVL